MTTINSASAQIAGTLLVVSAVTFFSGASIPFLMGIGGVWTAEVDEKLQLIGSNRTTWIVANGLFVVSIVLLITGFSQFSVILHDLGKRRFAYPALAILLAGAILWLAALALRLSVTLWAADALADAAPSTYEPFHRWGEMLLSVYMLLAYVAIAVYGLDLLQTEAFPVWLGWASLVVGIVAALSLVTRFPLFIFLIPAGTYVMPLVIGITMLAEHVPDTIAQSAGTS